MLRGNTQGKAFPQNVFDHWEMIKGLPLVDQKAQDLVLGIRKRKGLKPEMPKVADYADRMWLSKVIIIFFFISKSRQLDAGLHSAHTFPIELSLQKAT